MKELTIEQKAKRYDEAIERARYWEKNPTVWSSDDICQKLFPELKESEDERIRKAIISVLKGEKRYTSKEDADKYIAWLEKQGEQETLCDKCKKEHPSHSCQDITALGRCAVEHEQKSSDKVEPKFHKGEWITNGNYTWKILEATPLDYILQSQDGNTVGDTLSHVDEQFHSFTLEDAKNGDVLFDGSNILLVKEINHWHNITSYLAYSQVYGIREYLISNSDVIIPATKEQCDLLFQKMKKAGYELDAEKKELKKLGRKSIWNEEDEKVIHCLEYTVRHFYEDEDTIKWCCDWLKSLRPQSQWKPSEEQMSTLEYYMHILVCNKHKEILFGLYADLKKLRG